jgi:hypothetical protein
MSIFCTVLTHDGGSNLYLHFTQLAGFGLLELERTLGVGKRELETQIVIFA